MSALVLPGDIPGLLRMWSPILCDWEQADDPRGVIISAPDETHADVCWPWHQLDRKRGEWTSLTGAPPLSVLALTLENETGRGHAALWLASRHESAAWMTPCVGEALWQYAAGDDHPEGEGWPWSGWYLGDRFFCTEDGGEGIYVSGLADLNPEHPRTLEDGSRWVDAEALRLVCLHVAGL